jgi:tetratricopeptide (TPR) repeat protein
LAVEDMRWSTKSIARAASLLGAGFVALAALGGLVKAAGGSTGLAVAFAAIGVAGALAAFAFMLLQQRAEVHEDWQALWQRRPARVRELPDDWIYTLGVENEAPEALDTAGLRGCAHAPYAPRYLDEQLTRRLKNAAEVDTVDLITVFGPPKAGKSRTMLEAVRGTLGDAWLIAPKPTPVSLAGLASRGVPPAVGDGPCVVWLDDVELFAVAPGGDGLNDATLEGFRQWRRPVLVLGTAGGKGGGQLTGFERYAEPTCDLLRAHKPLELNSRMSVEEQQRLRDLRTYSQEAEQRIAQDGIGEFMIVAPWLRKRLTEGAQHPEGLAVTQAAIDWRRTGLIRPIPESALRALYVDYLRVGHSETGFQLGLRWATTPLYSWVALLLPHRDYKPRDSESRVYEPYDYIVRYDDERERPIPDGVWQQIFNVYAQDKDFLAIGVAAAALGTRCLTRGSEEGAAAPTLAPGYHTRALQQDEAFEYARNAWRRAESQGVALAANNLGVLLEGRGDLEGAEAAYRRADGRGDGGAALKLGELLQGRGDLEGAEAAYRRAAERGDPGTALRAGELLECRGNPEGAEIAYLRAAERGDPGMALQAGELLERRGNLEGARAAYLRAAERGDVGMAFKAGDRLRFRDEEAALSAYRRADKLGSADAAFQLGFLLMERNDLVGAEAAYRRSDNRGDAVAANWLGQLLKRRGDLEGAEAAFRRGIERGHSAPRHSLGILLHERGDLDSAEAIYRMEDERGDPEASFRLGMLLEQRGNPVGAEAAYQRADERTRNLLVSLETLLRWHWDFDGAEAAHRRAEKRGTAWTGSGS